MTKKEETVTYEKVSIAGHSQKTIIEIPIDEKLSSDNICDKNENNLGVLCEKTTENINFSKEKLLIGDGHFQIMAGPCTVESLSQVEEIAKSVKTSGATILRGGAYKARTSPYSFQGLGAEGIALLLEAKKITGMPIITEVTDISQLKYFDDVDIIQVGARNMQNYALLKELGKLNKPILLKRGNSCTLEELLLSAEYILAGGNEKVILCERGIRTFETATRNTLDLSAVPMLKSMTHLPVIVDPSHATGLSHLVTPMALAAVAAGADGLLIEVHSDPMHALCDGRQSLDLAEFADLSKKVARLRSLDL